MGRLLFLGLFSTISVVSLARPWVGVVAAYFIAILTPQAVWFWDFEGLRPALWILLPTFVGFIAAALRGNYQLEILKNRRTLFLAVLWACVMLSYYAGPYVHVETYRYTDPSWAISTLNKIFILYFLACVCLDTEKKLKALVGVFIVSAIYLIYWANARYLSGGLIGRLAGPVDIFGQGIYSDENNFAMLFVVACPFLWYLGYMFENRFVRWGLWLVIPFGWHAVFLTASRGGLVGLGATTLLMAWRSKNKVFGALLIPALVIVYVWQAGDLMRDRAATIEDYQTETSAETRLQAWDAALKMIADHPWTGVGLASFPPAFPDYSVHKPREAHNTFFQISAESGIIAGSMYALTVAAILLGLWRNGKRYKQKMGVSAQHLYLINEAILVSFFGLVVCSLFLSLQMFEIFYCLALMANTILFLERREEATATEAASSGKLRAAPLLRVVGSGAVHRTRAAGALSRPGSRR